jgi:thioredoxin reductase (NADPH)
MTPRPSPSWTPPRWPYSRPLAPDSRGRPANTSTGEGDASHDFFVVVSGAVEIVVDADGEERPVATHGPGHFLGELNLLTGQRVFVSARAAEPGEVIAVSRDALRRLIATTRS